LTEKKEYVEEEKRIFQEFEWIRISHLMALVSNLAGNKAKAIDFYKPSWHIEENIKDDRTEEDILGKFRKVDFNGK